MPIEYVTVEGVEVLSTGMQWKGMTGVYYVTGEHLADMVAAQADPLIRAARVKLGHLDPRFNAGLTSHDPWNLDAEPAFGTLTNLRLGEGGSKLLADLAEVPSDLAASLPSTFPNRSAEWVWDHETAGGRRYTAVLTDLALLGTRAQAVEDLADIVRANLPAAVADPIIADLTAAAAAREETALPEHPAASVSVDRICHVFNFEWAMDPDSVEGVDTYWWWVRDVRVDPDEVIASDGEGGTWRVPYTTDGDYEITFGEPVQVRETYVDITAAAAAASAAQARHQQQVLASFTERPAKPDRHNPAASRPRPEEGHNVSIDIPALRSRLQLTEDQLPDDATEEQINEALALDAETPGTPEAPEAESDVPAAPEQEPAAAGAADTVEVSRQVWEQTNSRLEALEVKDQERETAAATARRDKLVETAVRAGKIAPAEHDHYRGMADVDEDRTRNLLEGLAAGRVPVDPERGTQPTATAGDDALLAATRQRLNIKTPTEA